LDGMPDHANVFALPTNVKYSSCECRAKCLELGFAGVVVSLELPDCLCEMVAEANLYMPAEADFHTSRFAKGFFGWALGEAIGGKEVQLHGKDYDRNECMRACLKMGADGASMHASTEDKGACFCRHNMIGRSASDQFVSRYLGHYAVQADWSPGIAESDETLYAGRYDRVDCINMCIFMGFTSFSFNEGADGIGPCYCERGAKNFVETEGWVTGAIDRSFLSPNLK